MRSKLLLVLTFATIHLIYGQSNEVMSINSVQLHTLIEQYEEELDFYTGNESFYDGNEGLAAIVRRNWENGLKEGVYYGDKYNKISDYSAQKMSFMFFKDELFKVRWTFEYSAENKISVLAPKLTEFLNAKFGEPEVNDFGFVKNTIWKRGNYTLMLFQEGRAIVTIELRDDDIQEKVDAIK